MIIVSFGLSRKAFRFLSLSGMLLAYAFVIYNLTSLQDKWLMAMAALLAAVIALLWFGQRHLILLSALALAIPLVGFDFSLYYNEKLGGDYRIAFSLLDFALIALSVEYWLTVPRPQRQPLRPGALKWLMVGLFILALLSANVAKEPSLTFFEMVRLFRMMTLAWIIAKCVNNQEALRRVVMVLFIITIAEGALAFTQRLSGGQLGIEIVGEPEKVMTQELNTGDTAIRVGGTFGHANQFARFLGLILPLTLAVFIASTNKRDRVLAGVTLLAAGGALIATLSRAAWIGATVGSTVVFLSMIMRQTLRAQALRSLRLVLVLLAAFVLVNLGTLIARFTSEDEGSFATREPMALIAMKIIQDHPWGVGFGNYRVWLPRYGDPAVPFTFQAKVHNMYLLIAAEMGVMTLLVFLGIWGTAFCHGLALGKRVSSDLAMIAIGIAGGLLAFAIHCTVDYEEIARIPILWFYIGLLCAITGISTNGSHKLTLMKKISGE